MRIIFAGTPAFACPALHALIDGHRPIAVLTQPDRPAGRGRKLVTGPVKQLALEAGVEVLQPPTLKTEHARQMLAELAPDLVVTAAYGLLLPRPVLELPRHGCWNLHASLLPRWRGASPIQQAILAGDAETGISLMQMDEGLDTGDVLLTAATAVGDRENAGNLHDRLAVMAAEVLDQALERLAADRFPAPFPQDNSLATYAPLIQKSDARLDWNADAVDLDRQVRAYNPWPIAFGELQGRTLRIFRARAVPAGPPEVLAPGSLILDAGHPEAIRVACGHGALEILELQEAGRRRLGAPEWLNANPQWRG